MKFGLAVAAAAVLALAGCSGNQPGFGNGLFGSDAADSGTATEPIDQSYLAEPEPNTPEYFARLIGDTVYFEVDQSAITDQSANVLRQQASWLNHNPNFVALIEGHADEQGTREYNLALGARRAAAVRSFLVEQGVADHRLRTVTYGKERPVAVCSSETCWSKNRRSVSVVGQDLRG